MSLSAPAFRRTALPILVACLLTGAWLAPACSAPATQEDAASSPHSVPLLVVLWDASLPAPNNANPTVEEMRARLFTDEDSVRNYFLRNSYGLFTLREAVPTGPGGMSLGSGIRGWFQALRPADVYWRRGAFDPTSANNSIPPAQLVNTSKGPKYLDNGFVGGHRQKWAEGIRMAAADGFPFASFDSDGDGTLDPTRELAVLFVSPRAAGTGTGYQRDVFGRDFPSTQPLVVDGVIVPKIAEGYLGTGFDPSVVAHELAHLCLGAKDLYPQDPDTERHAYHPLRPGRFSLMDIHGWGADIDPVHKLRFGWLEPIEVTKSGWYELPAVEQVPHVLRLRQWGRHGDEFFIENRWPTSEAEPSLPDRGLAVWHWVDQAMVLPDSWARTPHPDIDPAIWKRLPGPSREVRLIRPYQPAFFPARLLPARVSPGAHDGLFVSTDRVSRSQHALGLHLAKAKSDDGAIVLLPESGPTPDLLFGFSSSENHGSLGPLRLRQAMTWDETIVRNVVGNFRGDAAEERILVSTAEREASSPPPAGDAYWTPAPSLASTIIVRGVGGAIEGVAPGTVTAAQGEDLDGNGHAELILACDRENRPPVLLVVDCSGNAPVAMAALDVPSAHALATGRFEQTDRRLIAMATAWKAGQGAAVRFFHAAPGPVASAGTPWRIAEVGAWTTSGRIESIVAGDFDGGPGDELGVLVRTKDGGQDVIQVAVLGLTPGGGGRAITPYQTPVMTPPPGIGLPSTLTRVAELQVGRVLQTGRDEIVLARQVATGLSDMILIEALALNGTALEVKARMGGIEGRLQHVRVGRITQSVRDEVVLGRYRKSGEERVYSLSIIGADAPGSALVITRDRLDQKSLVATDLALANVCGDAADEIIFSGRAAPTIGDLGPGSVRICYLDPMGKYQVFEFSTSATPERSLWDGQDALAADGTSWTTFGVPERVLRYSDGVDSGFRIRGFSAPGPMMRVYIQVP